MRLKSIELKGFKSFADKTVIHFDQDITGIVGPNGCGKSNIVDAVRWVLGEQKSKALRLEKMDNVIFNGTKDRHPSNIAEVSMTLDNTKNLLPTEYTTITVTRTISRDGASGYQLNGVACRLKDIRDLFLDTGISTDTYAIIELKMIDDILNDVDKARRRLLEQAAGVSKYKTRKHETLLKLKSTEADLTRVEDVLFEIEKNLKGLESQARKAKRYKVLKEEYKALTIDLASYELLDINEVCDLKQKDINALEDRILKVNTEIATFEAQLELFRQEVIEGEKSLSNEQKQLNDLVYKIQKTENDKKLLGQQEQFLHNKSKQLKESTQRAQDHIVLLGKEVEGMVSEIKTASSHLSEYKTAVESVESQLSEKRDGNLQLREQLQQTEKKVQEARQAAHQTEKELAVKQSNLDSLVKSAQQSLFENEERQKQLAEIEKDIDGFQHKITKQATLLAEIEQKEAENLERIAELEVVLEEKRNILSNDSRILDAKQNEYKLTKNMVDSLQGFPDAIKFLKKNAAWLKDALLLLDILYSEEEYRAAIETVLQPYLNHFIVEREEDALKSIQLLKDSGKGKTGFLVLEHFHKVVEDESLTMLPSKLIPMFSLLEIDEPYRPVLAYLLRNIYIATPDFKLDQWAIPDTFNGTIVSHSGDILRSPYQISGGSVGLFEGKRLGRVKNLEKLDQEIKKLDIKVLGLKKDVQDVLQELMEYKKNSYKTTIERERKDLADLEKSFVSKKTRIDNFKEVVEKNKERQTEVQANIEKLRNEIQPLKEHIRSAADGLKELEENAQALQKSYKEESEVFSGLQQTYNQNNIRFIQQENLYKSLQQNKTYKLQQIESYNEQTQENKNETEKIEKDLKALKEQDQQIDDFLRKAYEEKDEKLQALSSKESGFFTLKQNARVIEDSIRAKEKERRQNEENIVQFKDQLNEQKVRLNVLKEKLSFEFRIDISAFLDYLEEPETPKEDLSERMSKVKNRLDNFGEVNPMAEEAYDEMKDRYDFIISQRDDLNEAKESLLETIEEVDRTAKEQFMETFATVRENFIQVFRSMFTKDDACDLIIVNPEDILESDIEITAKPKGKRPQGINQLSGGEKTLTALSLLFALYLYKPAPFCMLDEVDAPLDDTNIKKFNDAIREFSKNSQFVVVTHNKATMAQVDSIYGVTMVKQGVSRVVPVNFSHLN